MYEVDLRVSKSLEIPETAVWGSFKSFLLPNRLSELFLESPNCRLGDCSRFRLGRKNRELGRSPIRMGGSNDGAIHQQT